MTYKYDEKNLVFKKTYELLKYKVVSICLLLLFAGTLLSAISINSKGVKKEYIETEIIIKNEDVEKDILKRIDELPFKYKDIIKAQALIESSHFKSAVFRHNNNVFGMRLARQRITLAKGDNLKHAVFNSWEDSIIDRLIYESNYMSKLNKEQYYAFLDRLYAEGDGYSGKLKQIIKTNKF